MQYALCPFCLSTLQITDEQLALKAGLIRCGHCSDVFDANENNLTPSTEAVEEVVLHNDNSDSEITTQNPSNDVSEPPTVAMWEKATIKPAQSLPYGLLTFILIVTFIVQFTYIESESLTQNTQLQPLFKKLNSAFNLHIPSYQNLEEIQIIERQLAPNSQLSDVLSLQLTIKNNALAEQNFPTITVALTSSLGEKVAQGVFTKYDYLKSIETNDLFASQALKQITLYFKKSEKDASGFEISFQP